VSLGLSRVPRRASRRIIVLAALAGALLCALPAGAEGSGSQTAAADALPELVESKPENPFSRFEIVSLGSYPITLFYVDFAFDLKRYYDNGFDSAYIPLLSSSSLTDKDRWTRLGVALGVSCFVGVLDAIIHAAKVQAAKRQSEAERTAAWDAAKADAASGP
jgi:hypothetical protein